MSEITAALDFVKKGGLVGLPTETVYGLGAPISSLEQIKKIFALKERPFFDPLIVHVSDLEQARKLTTQWPETAEALATRFWPGPLTMVLPKSELVSDLITSGLATVGVRIPSHPMALDFLSQLGEAVAAPSANKFTQTSPTSAQHVREIFAPEDVFVLDGGPCEVGVESTIIEVKENEVTLLRRGMITETQIQACFQKAGLSVSIKQGQTKAEKELQVPGSFMIHYRPPWPVVIQTRALKPADWEQIEQTCGVVQADWQERKLSSEAVIAARELYRALREPLEAGKRGLILELPGHGDDQLEIERWKTIKERLGKAQTLTF